MTKNLNLNENVAMDGNGSPLSSIPESNDDRMDIDPPVVVPSTGDDVVVQVEQPQVPASAPFVLTSEQLEAERKAVARLIDDAGKKHDKMTRLRQLQEEGNLPAGISVRKAPPPPIDVSAPVRERQEPVPHRQPTREEMYAEVRRLRGLVEELSKGTGANRVLTDMSVQNEVRDQQREYLRMMMNQIPEYNGVDTSLEKLVTFRSAAENFAAHSKLPNLEKTSFIVMKLTGQARLWWSNYCQYSGVSANQVCDTTTPSQLCDLLDKQFGPPNRELSAIMEIMDMRAESEKAVSAYTTKFRSFCMMTKSLPELVKCAAYLRGLPSDLRKRVWTQNSEIRTLDALIASTQHQGDPIVDGKHKMFPSVIREKANASAFVAQTGSSSQGDAAKIICHLCGCPGHYMRNCPTRPSSARKNSKGGLHRTRGARVGKPANKKVNPVRKTDAISFTASCNTKITNVCSDFLVDSGASRHMIGSAAAQSLNVTNKTKSGNKRAKVMIANGEMLEAVEINNMLCNIKTDSNKNDVCSKNKSTKHVSSDENISVVNNEVVLSSPLLVPDLQRNLFSIPAANKDGYDVTCWHDGAFSISKCGKLVFKSHPTTKDERYLSLYNFRLQSMGCSSGGNNSCEVAYSAKVQSETLKIFHDALGHPGYRKMSVLVKKWLGPGNLSALDALKCDACPQGKLPKLKVKTGGADHPLLGLIHTDICGPMPVRSQGGAAYILNFTDDCSKYCVTYLLKDKSAESVVTKFMEYVPFVERATRKKVLRLRSDQGTEFFNERMESFCKGCGIAQEASNVYSPHQNGTAERMNRTLITITRTMLMASRLPVALWGELHMHSVHLYNHRPHSSLKDDTPAEKFFPKDDPRRNLQFKFLYPVGSAVYASSAGPKRAKFSSRAIKGYFVGVGIGEPGVRYWIPNGNLVKTSSSVVVDASAPYVSTDTAQNMPFAPQDVAEYFVDCILDEKEENGKRLYKVRWLHHDESHDSWEPRTNLEDCVALDKWEASSENVFSACVATLHEATPTNVHTALKGRDCALWWEAMLKEYNAILDQGTFTVVRRPPGRKVVGTVWVLRIKQGTASQPLIYKARLCAQGFSQIPGLDFDETFAPTVSRAALRIVLALAVTCGMLVHVVDCKNAFLNGEIDKEIYMEQPMYMVKPGTTKTSHVWSLNKALYGLKQSPLIWNEALNTALEKSGFIRMKYEPCIYTRNMGKNDVDSGVHHSFIILAVYVDDITIAASTDEGLRYAKKSLSDAFGIKDEGAANKIIGIELKHIKNGLILHQTDYLQKVLSRFNMNEAKTATTPMENGQKMVPRNDDELQLDNNLYRQQVGALLYAAVCTRPDIAVAVNICSRYVESPCQRHYSALSRIMRFVRSKLDFGLRFVKDDKPVRITAFCDSDFAGDVADSKSTSGYFVFVNGCPVSWKTTKQKCVSTSTVEAEYIAASVACKEVIWVRNLVEEIMGYAVKDRPEMFIDNQGAKLLAHNNAVSDKTKHIRYTYHFIRECVHEGLLELKQVSTTANVADMMTKPLCKDLLERHMSAAHMISAESMACVKL